MSKKKVDSEIVNFVLVRILSSWQITSFGKSILRKIKSLPYRKLKLIKELLRSLTNKNPF